MTRIEVHVRGRGYRVTSPKCVKTDRPFVAWAEFGGDLEAAWVEVKARALEKLRQLHPDSHM
jgi:hypothetical protein